MGFTQWISPIFVHIVHSVHIVHPFAESPQKHASGPLATARSEKLPVLN